MDYIQELRRSTWSLLFNNDIDDGDGDNDNDDEYYKIMTAVWFMIYPEII